MNVLLISNMYPTKSMYGGIFIKNQYDFFKQNYENENNTFEIFYIPRRKTNIIGSLIKYIKAFMKFLPYYFKKYDILHVHYFFPLIILPFIYKKFYPKSKIILTFHGGEVNNILKYYIIRLFFLPIIRKSNYIIAVSEKLANNLYSKYNIKVNRILSAGINQNIFYKYKNISDKYYDFIFVGAFTERKGFDLLLKAIKLLDDNITYCLVGGKGVKSDKYEKILNNMYINEYKIHVFGSQSQTYLSQLYNKSKFFILPSRNEGFGLVATEALFCGTPAIVSYTGGLKEQIEEGKNGFFIKEFTPEHVAKRMREAMSMDLENYKQMSDYASRSNKEFSLYNIGEELYNIYKFL